MAKKKKTNVYDTASESYNDLLAIYFNEYYDLLMLKKYDPTNLTLN